MTAIKCLAIIVSTEAVVSHVSSVVKEACCVTCFLFLVMVFALLTFNVLVNVVELDSAKASAIVTSGLYIYNYNI